MAGLHRVIYCSPVCERRHNLLSRPQLHPFASPLPLDLVLGGGERKWPGAGKKLKFDFLLKTFRPPLVSTLVSSPVANAFCRRVSCRPPVRRGTALSPPSALGKRTNNRPSLFFRHPHKTAKRLEVQASSRDTRNEAVRRASVAFHLPCHTYLDAKVLTVCTSSPYPTFDNSPHLPTYPTTTRTSLLEKHHV